MNPALIFLHKFNLLSADLEIVDFTRQIQLLDSRTKIAAYSEASCTGNTVSLHLHIQLPTDFPINLQTNIANIPSVFCPKTAKFPTVVQWKDEWSVSSSGLCYGYLGTAGGVKVSITDENTKWLDISTTYFRKV